MSSKLTKRRNLLMSYQDVSYKINEFVLSNINFDIKKGELIAFSGESGSGKSTIINFLLGGKNYLGNIYFDYIDLKKINEKEMSNNIFVLQQITDDNLDPLSKPINIFEEIRQIRKKPVLIWKNLILNITKLFGLETDVLEKNILFLSGGQKQKVSIIKSILFNPKLLILDESLSALDPESKKNIMQFIIQWKNETKNSVIYITHNIKDLFLCDKVIFLSNGRTSVVEKNKDIIKELNKVYSREVIDFFLS